MLLNPESKRSLIDLQKGTIYAATVQQMCCARISEKDG